MTVLFFGSLAEITGNAEVEFEFCDSTDKLKEQIFNRFPGIKNQNFKIALNHEVVNGNETIRAGDELALLAPFAGG